MNLQRDCGYVKTIGIANGAAVSSTGGDTAGEIDLKNWAGGLILVPSAWTAADITFSVAPYSSLAAVQSGLGRKKPAPTFSPLFDKVGVLVRITTIATSAAQWYEVPAQVFMGAVVKIHSTNTASAAAVNQGAARTLQLLRKS